MALEITIIAVGKKMPDWVTNGFNEYAKRFPSNITLKLKELSAAQRTKSNSAKKCMEQERDAILSACNKNNLILALDEHGKTISSTSLASMLNDWQEQARNVDIIIGGADGLHKDVKQTADRLISLSNLTLPHAMVRVLLTEQLYRAWTITQQHPYHRE